MKHSGLSAAIAIGLFITAAQAYAQEPACSLKTVKGRYLFSTSGTILPPAFGVSVPTPGASAGVNVFNGDGTGTATVTVRVNGSTFLSNAVVPLSYTVNPDCTGTYQVLVPNGPTFNIYVAPNGGEMATIATDPGNYVSSIDVMVAPR